MPRYEESSLPQLDLRQLTATVGGEPEIDSVVGPMFGRLLQAMGEAGLDTEQPTVAWYHQGDDGLNLGVGLPQGDSLPPEFSAHTLPAVERAFVTRYEGGLAGIPAAWQALHEHAVAEGLTPVGPCREVYLAGNPKTGGWVIDLQQPVS